MITNCKCIKKLTWSDHEILIMCENYIFSSQVCLHSSVNSQLQRHQGRLREPVFFPTAEQNYQTLNDSIDMEVKSPCQYNVENTKNWRLYIF